MDKKYYFIYFFIRELPSRLDRGRPIMAIDSCAVIDMHPFEWMAGIIKEGKFIVIKFYEEISKERYDYFVENCTEKKKKKEEPNILSAH